MTLLNEQSAKDSESLGTAALPETRAVVPNWIVNANVLLGRGRLLVRIAGAALLVNIAITFLIPRHFESTARIMPPENSGSGTAMLAALAGRAMGGDVLGGLASSLMGGHNTGALFMDLLRSATVTGRLLDRFQLQSVYHKRYRVDATKTLIRRTRIEQDKKSGILTLTVVDTDPQRARDMAQAYLEELNLLVNRTSTSSAHRERLFIENRLAAVRAELDRAQDSLSNFSSTHMTVDLKEQTRATVDAAARLQGELIATQGELTSLQQIYGDGNVRVRAAEARAGNLRSELAKIGGTSATIPSDTKEEDDTKALVTESVGLSYPPLRQLPRLAIPYGNLYRNVRVQETVLELLTQQYEIAQIQEAKDVPVLSVIDPPGIPEKKSFPPRTLLALGLTLAELLAVSAFLILRHHWLCLSSSDPLRVLAQDISGSLTQAVRRAAPSRWRAA